MVVDIFLYVHSCAKSRFVFHRGRHTYNSKGVVDDLPDLVKVIWITENEAYLVLIAISAVVKIRLIFIGKSNSAIDSETPRTVLSNRVVLYGQRGNIGICSTKNKCQNTASIYIYQPFHTYMVLVTLIIICKIKLFK